jgi:ATP-dependent helicase HrpB
MSEARGLLRGLAALDETGALTDHGRRMADLPLPPRLAHMVLTAAASGQAARAARIAALLQERGLGGRDTDLEARLDAFTRDRGPRARDAAALASRWAGAAGPAGQGPRVSDGVLLALAYPERVAKARGAPGHFQLASGRGAFLDATEALAREPWLAVAELGGGEARDRILLAARVDLTDLMDVFSDRLERESRLAPDAGGKLRAREVVRLGRLVIEERLMSDPDPALIVDALLEEVRRKGVERLPWGDTAGRLRARAGFLRGLGLPAPDLSNAALAADLDAWLAPALTGRRSLGELDDAALETALRALIPHDDQRRMDTQAPERFEAPTGSRLAIDYGAEGGPRVEVRVQELFGLRQHPTVAGGRAPLTLALLSPAHRPIQLTRDLPGFWNGSWAEVRKEMRGRYPKHDWPEDPAAAQPTTRAKPRR